MRQPGAPSRRRSWWGWGYEDEALSDTEAARLVALVGERFGLDGAGRQPPPVTALELPRPRLEPPAALAPIAASDPWTRAAHAYGKAYRDVVRALAGRIDHPPDVVVTPRSEAEVRDVLDWCAAAGAAVIPYGGGSSVVGGVEPDVGEAYRGAVTLDLGALDRVVEVDEVSLAARIEAGALGPALESQLRARGLTLRHFPQSFECSTIGGWVATRAGGHFATGPTHIDDLVEALRVVTPAGTVQTRRLPASGAGPSPDRLFLGSEGVLGVITEVWVRVRRRPVWRGGGAATFPTFAAGAAAVRALAQSGLQPANCRLVDPLEAAINGAGDGSAAVLLVGFESADAPVDAAVARAGELVQDLGGTIDRAAWAQQAAVARGGRGEKAAQDSGPAGSAPGTAAAGRAPVRGAPEAGGAPSDAAGAWRRSFLRAPYVRDALVRYGVLCETFETAVTWDRFDALHDAVTAAVREALGATGSGAGFVTCRTTHAYPDGVAPYFTVIAPARRGAEVEQWDEVKAAAATAVLAAGGTITHHHAVGRDHRRWYDQQRPELFAGALRAAKVVLDPQGICNPGVLIDPGG